MTRVAVHGAGDERRPARIQARPWRVSPPGDPVCGAAHRGGAGSLDESARRLSHEELAVARRLAGEGHAVRSLPEGRGLRRTADFELCGTATLEVKSWMSLEDRPSGAPGPRSVANKLAQAEGQSSHVVLHANGSGLTASVATAGVARFAATHPRSGIESIRVMGDGFDLAWTRGRAVEVRRHPDSARRPGLSPPAA